MSGTGISIERIELIDDDPQVRSGYKDTVEDLGLHGEEVPSLADFEKFAATLDATKHAVICDYQLKNKTYSPVDGNIIVPNLYKRGIAALLCTRYVPLDAAIRQYRRYIPVVLSARDLSEQLIPSLELCLEEHKGNFVAERKPWRALVRVEGIEQVHRGKFRLNVVVPGWRPDEGVQIDISKNDVSAVEGIAKEFSEKGVCRVKARVNLGAESPEDLFFDEWTLA